MIVVVGMGFFMDVYDLFSIFLVIKLLGCIYYIEINVEKLGILFLNVFVVVNGVVFCGILIG